MDSNIIIFGHRPNSAEGSEKLSGVPLDELPLTMVYAPMQPYGSVYNDDEALKNGTLFKNIDKPFLAVKRWRR